MELNSFEKWVLKQKIWVHVVLALCTYFVWVIIYLYCKFKENKVNQYKEEQIKKENEKKSREEQEYIDRINRKKDNLIFDKKIKVLETSHPKRQKLLKDIDFIVKHGDTPQVSVGFEKNHATIYYTEIDSDEEKEIGCFYDYTSKLSDYSKSPDYKINVDFETNIEDDIYVLYCIVKVYN